MGHGVAPGRAGCRNWTGWRNGAATGRPLPERRREAEPRRARQRGGVERGVAARLRDAGGVRDQRALRVDVEPEQHAALDALLQQRGADTAPATPG